MRTVEEAFRGFISAFNALNLEALRQHLAADVTLFAPSPSGRSLIEGASEVSAHFAAVFASEPPQGPNIVPTSVSVNQLSAEAAFVTFEFARKEGGSIGRRTFILRCEAAGWLVVHIHASNSVPAQSNHAT